MAAEKQPILEPVSYDDKNSLATVFTFLAVATWALGTVLTIFSGLAFAGVGTFNEMLGEENTEMFTLSLVLTLAVSVAFSGLFFFTVSAVIRLLQRNATTVYALRGLDGVIPKQITAVSAPAEKNSKANESPHSDQKTAQGGSHARASQTLSDGSNVQITVNVNAPGTEAGASSPQQSTASPVSEREEALRPENAASPSLFSPARSLSFSQEDIRQAELIADQAFSEETNSN
ncbi:MAG: hypothetical protein IKE58_02285 [Blautia sp.]|nr:hypothetical protein [Blautia sp.]